MVVRLSGPTSLVSPGNEKLSMFNQQTTRKTALWPKKEAPNNAFIAKPVENESRPYCAGLREMQRKLPVEENGQELNNIIKIKDVIIIPSSCSPVPPSRLGNRFFRSCQRFGWQMPQSFLWFNQIEYCRGSLSSPFWPQYRHSGVRHRIRGNFVRFPRHGIKSCHLGFLSSQPFISRWCCIRWTLY